MPYLAGNISGFDIRLSPLGETGAYVANIHGYNVYSADTASAVGVYNTLLKAPERRLQYAKEQAAAQEAELTNLRKLEGQPFEKAEELKAAQQALDEINAKAVEEGNEKPLLRKKRTRVLRSLNCGEARRMS